MSRKKKSPEANNYVYTVRDGAIAANIFRGAAPDGHTYLYYEISRSWKAQSTGRQGYSKKFYMRNEEPLTKVIALASRWIEEHPEAADGAVYEPCEPQARAA